MNCLICKAKLNKGNKFCSRKCYWKYLSTNVSKHLFKTMLKSTGATERKKVCKNCGKIIHCAYGTGKGVWDRKKFCSRKCSSLFNRVQRVEKKCVVCDKIFKVLPCRENKKTCSKKCESQLRSTAGLRIWGVYPETAKNRKHLRVSTQYKNWRGEVMKRDNYKCVQCGGTKQLEVDHIKPFLFFPELRLSIDNGRTLCKKCHRETDTFGVKLLNYKYTTI